MTQLALLGGDAAFPEGIPFVRPPAPALERVTEILVGVVEARHR